MQYQAITCMPAYVGYSFEVCIQRPFLLVILSYKFQRNFGFRTIRRVERQLQLRVLSAPPPHLHSALHKLAPQTSSDNPLSNQVLHCSEQSQTQIRLVLAPLGNPPQRIPIIHLAVVACSGLSLSLNHRIHLVLLGLLASSSSSHNNKRAVSLVVVVVVVQHQRLEVMRINPHSGRSAVSNRHV